MADENIEFTLDQRVSLIKLWYQYESNQSVNEEFQELYPGVAPPSRVGLYKLRKKFETTGSVCDAKRSGRPKSVTTPEAMQEIAQAFVHSPKKSTRRASLELDISRRSLQRMMHKLKLKPFIPRLVQSLTEDDPDRRLQFCELLLNQAANEEGFLEKLFWTDEAMFKLNGHVNKHNAVYWSDTNPHLTISNELNSPGVLVWGGISAHGLIGPFFFEGNITGVSYLNMLQNDVIPALRVQEFFNEMIWQQDGAPPHFQVDVRNFLDQTFPKRWMGRRGAVDWPPRSPDLTPMDFSVWGIIKDLVYATKPQNIQDLRQKIEEAFHYFSPELCSVICLSVPDRCRSCIANNGLQFEHYE